MKTIEKRKEEIRRGMKENVKENERNIIKFVE